MILWHDSTRVYLTIYLYYPKWLTVNSDGGSKANTFPFSCYLFNQGNGPWDINYGWSQLHLGCLEGSDAHNQTLPMTHETETTTET